ncbi:alpha/beta fold hydrolase [Streptomyces sp. NPDC091292]|uniref:alpha/beta fold hydrolase n=1 Tax=Streptomyces sp. NPDC091292 TaxID=3365991 RepID=UPI00382F3DE8
MTFVRIGGVPHHVETDGSGPVCVLSAGLGLCWFDWDPVVPLLAPHRTVVRFDRPGLGLSAPARGMPTLQGEAERIGQLLDALGLDGPATLVGHSLAGFHCEAFARRHPARVAGLVLVDTSIEERPRARRAAAVRDACTRACGTALARAGVPRALGPALRRTAVRASRHGGGDPAPDALVRAVYGTGRVFRTVIAENARYHDQATDLAALRRTDPLPPGLPVTVLAADPGGWSAARWLTRQRALAAELDAAYWISSPSGHMVMLDRPRDVADAILATG